MPNEEDTKVTKTSISQATTYEEMAEFWDNHSLTEYWDRTYPVEFKVNLQSRQSYYRVDASLADRLREVAKSRGISPETLLNLWVQEKLQEEIAC